MKTYFINSTKENCGVYQLGLRVWDIVKHTKLDIEYKEIGSKEEFLDLDFQSVDLLFFNWIEGGATGPFGWYNHDMIQYLKSEYDIKTATIIHTFDFNTATFDFCIDQDPHDGGLTRPLYEFSKPKIKNEIPTLCSFGLAFEHKGFDDVVHKVNAEFDNAVLNLHITNAHYGDASGTLRDSIVQSLKAIPLKPGITLNITTDFKSNEDLLDFVNSADMLVLGYRRGTDISSVPDYAISTETPIALTDIGQFRHIYKSEIDINKNSLPEILEFYKNQDYISQLKQQWSREVLLRTFEQFVTEVCETFTEKTYSQVNQDRFALKLIGKGGYFLDIGAGWDYSGVNSNTLLLEQNGWSGICVEGDHASAERRSSKKGPRCVVENVYIPQTTILELLQRNNAPKVIDYVNIDIEPSSLTGLENFPFDQYDAKVITFEHDLYRLGPEQKETAYNILTNHGYVRLCENINVPEAQGVGLYFEDWYINPKYFSNDFIQANQFKDCHGSHIIDNLVC